MWHAGALTTRTGSKHDADDGRRGLTLWMTLHPPQRPKTEPLDHACGLTGRMLVVPHRLHVNLICEDTKSMMYDPGVHQWAAWATQWYNCKWQSWTSSVRQ